MSRRRNTWTIPDSEVETVETLQAYDDIYRTTNQHDFIEQDYTYQRPRKRTWTKDDVNKFYHQETVITDVTTTDRVDKYEKRTPIKHDDNLYPSGDFPKREQVEFVPAERPTPGKKRREGHDRRSKH